MDFVSKWPYMSESNAVYTQIKLWICKISVRVKLNAASTTAITVTLSKSLCFDSPVLCLDSIYSSVPPRVLELSGQNSFYSLLHDIPIDEHPRPHLILPRPVKPRPLRLQAKGASYSKNSCCSSSFNCCRSCFREDYTTCRFNPCRSSPSSS